jgi:hypothetical protein
MGNRLTGVRTMGSGLRKDQVLAILMLANPVTIYITSNFGGFGIQFPLFRLEGTSMGYSVISIIQDLNFVTFWLVLWVFGVGILLSGIVLSLLEQVDIQRSFKRTGILIVTSGIFFFLSTMLKYYVVFFNTEIVIIPVGIIVMMVAGWWIFKTALNQPPVDTIGE